MKKVCFVLWLFFSLLTMAGAIYVLWNGGRVSAGHAVVPMVLAVVSMTFYRGIKDK